MATQIGSAFIGVTADVSSAESTIGSFAGTATKALVGIGAAAAAGFGLAAKSSIDMNASLETAELQFTTLLGSADEAQAHVASLFEFAAKTPFETAPIIEASKQLQIFGGAALNNEEILTLVGDASAAMGADITEVAGQVGRFYSAIQGGAPVGEMLEQLLRMGIIGPEVRTQINGMVEAGADADEIFGVLTGTLGNMEGAMALQADSWKGLTSSIVDNVGLLNAQAFAPLFEFAKDAAGALLEFLSSDTAQRWADNVASAISSVIGDLGDLGGALTSGGISGGLEALNIDPGAIFGNLIGLAQEGIGNLVDWLASDGIDMIFGALVEGRGRMVEAALTLFPAIVEGLVEIIPGLLDVITGQILPAIIDFIATGVPQLLNAAVQLFQGLIAGLVQVFPTIISTLQTVIPLIISALVTAIPQLLSAAVSLFGAILDALVLAIPLLIQTLTQLIPQIFDALISFLPQLLESAVMLFQGIIEGLVVILPLLLEYLLGTLVPTVLETLLTAIPQILEAAIQIFMALIEGVAEVLPQLINVLVTQVFPAVISTILDNAPKILESAITAFLTLVQAVVDILPELLVTLLTELLPAVLSTILDMAPELLSTAIDAFFSLVTGIIEIIPDLVSAIIFDVIPAIVGALIDSIPKLIEAGGKLIGGLVTGIIKNAGKVVSSVVDAVVKPITDLWPFSPAKSGPFRTHPPEVAGANVIELFGEGMRSAAQDLARAAEEVMPSLGLDVSVAEEAIRAVSSSLPTLVVDVSAVEDVARAVSSAMPELSVDASEFRDAVRAVTTSFPDIGDLAAAREAARAAVVPAAQPALAATGTEGPMSGGNVINVTIPGTGSSTSDAARVAQLLNSLVRA